MVKKIILFREHLFIPDFLSFLDAGRYQGLTGDDILLLPMDLTKFDTHQNCVNKVLEHFGKVSKTFSVTVHSVFLTKLNNE